MVHLARHEDLGPDHPWGHERFGCGVAESRPALRLATMHILVIHNTYQQPGGEDVVVAQERHLLEQNGHTVSNYTRSNLELEDLSAWQKLGLVARIYSAEHRRLAVPNLLRNLT